MKSCFCVCVCVLAVVIMRSNVTSTTCVFMADMTSRFCSQILHAYICIVMYYCISATSLFVCIPHGSVPRVQLYWVSLCWDLRAVRGSLFNAWSMSEYSFLCSICYCEVCPNFHLSGWFSFMSDEADLLISASWFSLKNLKPEWLLTF